jgi:hypothetical protein
MVSGKDVKVNYYGRKFPAPTSRGCKGLQKKAEPILTLPSPCIKYHNSFQKVLRNFWEKIVGQNA